jgi:hypothetical protein
MMFLLAVVLVGAALYFVPTVIAAVRNGKHLGAVIVVNVPRLDLHRVGRGIGDRRRQLEPDVSPLVRVLATARLVVLPSTSSITTAARDMAPGPAASVRPYNRLRRREGGVPSG